MLVLATLLFVLLSPGVLLTLPAGSRGIIMSGETSFLAVLVHAVLFYFLLPFLAPTARSLGLEGFQDEEQVNDPSNEPKPCTQEMCAAIGLKCCGSGDISCKFDC